MNLIRALSINIFVIANVAFCFEKIYKSLINNIVIILFLLCFFKIFFLLMMSKTFSILFCIDGFYIISKIYTFEDICYRWLYWSVLNLQRNHFLLLSQIPNPFQKRWMRIMDPNIGRMWGQITQTVF